MISFRYRSLLLKIIAYSKFAPAPTSCVCHFPLISIRFSAQGSVPEAIPVIMLISLKISFINLDFSGFIFSSANEEIVNLKLRPKHFVPGSPLTFFLFFHFLIVRTVRRYPRPVLQRYRCCLEYQPGQFRQAQAIF